MQALRHAVAPNVKSQGLGRVPRNLGNRAWRRRQLKKLTDLGGLRRRTPLRSAGCGDISRPPGQSRARSCRMARVTVEDCIDKVENRFDLVLLASHRARMISSGGQIAVERDNDKNPVVALREIAEKAVSPEDLKEELVHSLQKYVEVDEPEPEGIPLIGAPGTGVDADDTEVTTDRMSEEELLKGLEGLTPPESQPEPDSDVGDEEE